LIAAASLAACTLDKTPPTLTDSQVAIQDAGKPPGFDANGIILLAPGARRPLDGGADASDMGKTGSSGDAGKLDAGREDAGTMHTNGSDRDAAAGKPKPPTMPPAQPCNGSCPSDKPRCLPNNTCAQCALDSDCHAGTPRCDTQSNTCVACVANTDCPGATPICDLTAHVCRQCTADAHCGGTTPRCDPSAHACVQCLDDSSCGGGTPRCDTTAHRCVQCTAHADCTTHEHPECANHVCSLCTSDAACNGRPGAGACDVARGDTDDDDDESGEGDSSSGGSGACVECSPSNVSACASGMCNGGNHRCGAMPLPPTVAPCTACTRDRDCGSGKSCSVLRLAGRRVGSYCVPPGNNACLTSCALGVPIGCN
jgi:hypothetical protein